MAGTTTTPVTMRVKIGNAELEVSGPQKFVEKKVEEFITTQGGRRETAAVGVPSSDVAPAGQTDKTSTLAQLLKKAAVKSDVDRALVAGYYLETIKGMPSFTAAEIKDAIRQAKVSPPSNPSDVIAKNIKKA